MSSFRETYPDFASIEAQIRAARAERAVYLATLLSNLLVAIGRGFKIVAAGTAAGIKAYANQRAIGADELLQRSLPRY